MQHCRLSADSVVYLGWSLDDMERTTVDDFQLNPLRNHSVLWHACFAFLLRWVLLIVSWHLVFSLIPATVSQAEFLLEKTCSEVLFCPQNTKLASFTYRGQIFLENFSSSSAIARPITEFAIGGIRLHAPPWLILFGQLIIVTCCKCRRKMNNIVFRKKPAESPTELRFGSPGHIFFLFL